MAEIGIENLTPQHRNEYHHIYAFDDRESVLVEDRKWMPRFVSREHSAPESKFLYVRVSSCNSATIQSIKDKIGAK
jgi:hypothetical protein